MTKRKKIMKQKEMVWRKSEKLSDLEQEAHERAQSLLQRANNLRLEQEEELKDMSKVGTSFLPPSSADSGPLPLPPLRLRRTWGKEGGTGEGLVERGVAVVRGRTGLVTC